jgi:hypothetical protein
MPQPHDEDRDSSSVVSYSVKELLGEIKSSIDRLDIKLTAKADREEVLSITSQLQRDVRDLDARLHHERTRIDGIVKAEEVEDKVASKTTEWRRWSIPTLLTVLLVVLAILQLKKM